MSTPLQPFPAAARLVRAEHVVLAGAALALVVLVALPLAFLVAGSATSEDGVTLAQFRDALSSRLYVQALCNSAVARAERAGVAQ
jgi:ABC-type sulfate transport system permease component